jgi:tetratricopeptide (TPR) repeat protein
MEHSGFPSDETLAAFIDGRLDDITRRRVIEHMTTCDECYAVYIAATEMGKAAAAPPRRRAMPRHFWAATIAMSAAVVLVFVHFAELRRYLGLQPSGIDKLVSATSGLRYRTVEGRLSGFQTWEPLQENNRAVPAEVQFKPEYWPLLSAASKINGATSSDPSPENLHALGVSHLLVGNFDDAISTLKAAVQKRPGDAAIVNDLATAYLARGRFREEASDYVEAAEQAKKAWALKKTPEIAWTRAVALERMHLQADARAAWNDYLALDTKSPWRIEAGQHVKGLNAPTDGELWLKTQPLLEHAAGSGDAKEIARIADGSPQEAAAFADETLLVRWANTGDPKALAAADAIGRAVAPRGYGALQAACVAARKASPEQVGLTRRAILALNRGRSLLANGDNTAAYEAMTSARELAVRAGSPVAQLALMEQAVCAFWLNDYDSTNEHLDALQQELARASWRSFAVALSLRADFIRGLTQFETGHPHDALRSYERALEAAKACGHREWETKLHSLIGLNYEFLGDPAKAWKHRRTALRLAASSGSLQRMQYVLMEATVATVLYERHPELSDILTRRLLEISREMKVTSAVADAHIWRARYLSGSGGSGAVGELRRARIAVASIDDPDSRERATANLEMAEGELIARDEPRTAVARLTESLRFFDESGNHLLLAQAYAARAGVYESVHDQGRASSDRNRGIAELESARSGITDAELRTTFAEVSRRLYTDAVNLAVTSGDYSRAFDLAERSRATTAGVAPAAGYEQLRKILPAGMALVEYAALPGRTLAWIVRREGVTATILPSKGEAISADADRMIAARGDQRPFDVAASDLYTRLITPLRARLSNASSLVFVSDPAWTRIPFAALRDPVTGHFLLADFDVASMPSAARLALAIASASRPRDAERVLVCADPDAADAPRLISARREGEMIATTFPGASVISGISATRNDFLSRAQSATLIHFAGHARNDTRDRAFSALIFSGDGQSGSGALYAWEIRKLNLSHARLVVLAACGTDAISDAFLAAGAPATIATLWDIGDDHGRTLMSKMYQRLHDGDPPSRALRTAQLAVMQDPGSRPADWAGYELVGL